MIEWPSHGISVRYGEPLSRHTAARTGGPCDVFVVVDEVEALPAAIGACGRAGWNWTILGAGTRVAVRDGGLAGAVVRLGTGFYGIRRAGDQVEVGASTPVAALVAWAIGEGLAGAESLAGIPGTCGASLLCDADACWPAIVERVRYLARDEVRAGTLAECRGAARPVLLSAAIRLEKGDSEALRASVRKRLARSAAASWYAPIRRGTVREAVRRARMAGVRLRQASIPESAPEMIVNLGGAPARDLSLLQRSVIDRVSRECGITLRPRIQWMGREPRTEVPS